VFKTDGMTWRLAFKAIGITGFVIALLTRLIIMEPKNKRRITLATKSKSVNHERNEAIMWMLVRWWAPMVSLETGRFRGLAKSQVCHGAQVVLDHHHLGCTASTGRKHVGGPDRLVILRSTWFPSSFGYYMPSKRFGFTDPCCKRRY